MDPMASPSAELPTISSPVLDRPTSSPAFDRSSELCR
jgi:hypothetical protein